MPPGLCRTIKNRGWEKMDCSLPSHSVLRLLDGIIGPRWQAGRREVSSSSIWPSGRWSGPRVPGLGSLQMWLMLPQLVSSLLPLQGIFHTKSFWTRRTGRFLSKKRILQSFPLWGYIFTQRCVDPKACREVVSELSPWRSGVLGRDVGV